MISVRLLRIRCTSWDQVAAFYSRKLRKQRYLSLRVPFAAEKDVPVTVGLELPTGVVVALDGIVRAVTLHADNPNPLVELELVGDIEAQVARLADMVADASAPEGSPAVEPVSDLAVAVSRSLSVRSLDHRLAAMRDLGVRGVLGLEEGATYEDALAARMRLRREFGVVYNRPAFAALRQINEEILILVERAFTQFVLSLGDASAHRLRNYRVLVEQGSYFLGQGLSRDDVEIPATPALDVDALFGDMVMVIGDDASREVAISGQRSPTNEALAKARRMLSSGEPEQARVVLTSAMREEPKSRALRALFHVAGAVVALKAGNGAQAISQLETATLYDDACREAKALLDLISMRTGVDDSQLTRLFQ